jgi:hypothetical protein
MWRYIDLWKFEKMLTSKSIYFSRADKFKDPFEGKFTPDYSSHLSPSDAAFYEAYKIKPVDPVAKETAHDSIRKCTFISCWHMAKIESPRMWDVYTNRQRVS